MIPLLDRANRALITGRTAEADSLMRELLEPQPGPIAVARAWLSRLWHRATCREPRCIYLFGAYQHPRRNLRS